MDSYDLRAPAATSRCPRRLTNWYVRRSRDPFLGAP